MDFVWNTAVKDLRRRARDPVALLLWAGMPFVVGLILTLAFGRAGTKPQARLLVADRDDTILSGLVIAVFGQGELSELVRVEQVELEEGRERIGKGDGSALLIIPEGFGAGVLGQEATALQLITNPAQTILPAIVEEILSLLVDAVLYLQLILGDDLQLMAQGPPEGTVTFPDATMAGLSVKINRLVSRVSGILFPPVLGLETIVEGDDTADLNLGALFFQGMFFMAILFMAQALAEDVWQERLRGTWRRVLTAPRPLAAALAGKLLAGALLMLGMSLLALSAAGWFHGFEASTIPAAVLWSTFSGVAFLALFTLLHLFASSQRTAGMLASLVMFPLLMVGGSFFPFELMPDWLAALGRWTPNGWALGQLKAILGGSVDRSDLARAMAGLAGVTMLAFLLALRRLRRGFALA